MFRTFIIALFLLIPKLSLPAPLDRVEQPPNGWTGRVFKPSYAFPRSLPASEPRLWEAINFKKDARGYMAAVLSYVLEGQDLATWDISSNPVRKWYHAPWMGPGGKGREFINGLTRERSSRPLELGSLQTNCRQNWGVGFYNPVGGYTFGQIWGPVAAGTGKPNLSGLPFSEGTVVAKLLFTEATATEVPLLGGAPEVEANINVRSNPADVNCPLDTAPRAPAKLRLLQLDVAVRDLDATETGWVFGTFVYDGRIEGTDPWAKLKPVGLMWGNDFELSDDEVSVGKKPTQSIVLSDFGLGTSFGRGGRMNGPVDNRVSACISCHMTAQWPNSAPVTPPTNAAWDVASCWFRNLGPTTPFGAAPSATTTCGSPPSSGGSQTSLDFSLQLGVGLRNYASQTGAPFAETFTLDELKASRADRRVLKFDGVISLPIDREGQE